MMKNFLAVLLLFITANSFGLDIITRDGKPYWNCEIKKVERDGVRIMHRDGTAFLDFDELPSVIQKQYGWTAEKSVARKADRTAAAEAQRLAGENARRAQAERAAAMAQEKERAIAEQQPKAQDLDNRPPIEATSKDQPQNSDLSSWLKWGLCALLIVGGVLWLKKAKARHNRKVEINRQAEEARRFLELAKARNAFPTVATHLALKDEEFAFYEAASAFYEKRAVRHRGDSVSSQEWRKIAAGMFTVTNKRIIFDGGGIVKNVKFDKVMSVKPWIDGVEISIEDRQKGMMFGAGNPMLVGLLIQYFSRGGSPGSFEALEA